MFFSEQFLPTMVQRHPSPFSGISGKEGMGEGLANPNPGTSGWKIYIEVSQWGCRRPPRTCALLGHLVIPWDSVSSAWYSVLCCMTVLCPP